VTRWPARSAWLVAGCVAAALAAPRAARAQGNTDETLERAVHLYEDLQVERALVMLRQVISPSSPFVVSLSQRVKAYKYLGAAHAILGRRDSASVYFRAAIERDPFVDLDAQSFTPVERDAFAEARLHVFAVAIRPIERTRIDPRTEHMTFVVLSTHDGFLHADLHDPTGGTSTILASENDGVREIAWDGVLADGRLAMPGRYELVVRGESKINAGRTDSTRLYFDVELDRPALEDTLPALRGEDLLPERYPRSASAVEAAKGIGIALTALAVPAIIGGKTLGAGARGMGIGMAVVGVGVGTAAFAYREQHDAIAPNIAENARRRAERATANAEIERRNEQKIAQTGLVISPAAGVGP
jgi:tetratricopeptide (TPR) repeat protein